MGSESTDWTLNQTYQPLDMSDLASPASSLASDTNPLSPDVVCLGPVLQRPKRLIQTTLSQDGEVNKPAPTNPGIATVKEENLSPQDIQFRENIETRSNKRTRPQTTARLIKFLHQQRPTWRDASDTDILMMLKRWATQNGSQKIDGPRHYYRLFTRATRDTYNVEVADVWPDLYPQIRDWQRWLSQYKESWPKSAPLITLTGLKAYNRALTYESHNARMPITKYNAQIARVLLIIQVRTGARMGHLLMVRKNHVTWQEGRFCISIQHLKTDATGRRRTVHELSVPAKPISPISEMGFMEPYALLLNYLNFQGWNRAEFTTQSLDSGYFFPHFLSIQKTNIKPLATLDTAGFSRIMRVAYTKYGLPKVTAHSGRRTASCMAYQALTPQEANQMMGWAPESNTIGTYTAGLRTAEQESWHTKIQESWENREYVQRTHEAQAREGNTGFANP